MLTFKEKINTRSKACFDKEVVYVTFRNINDVPIFSIMRRYRKPENTEHLIPIQNLMRLASNLWKELTPLGKNSFRRYTQQYNMNIHSPNKRPLTGFAVFVQMIVKVNDTSLTTMNAFNLVWGSTINEFMDHGILKTVPGNYGENLY